MALTWYLCVSANSTGSGPEPSNDSESVIYSPRAAESTDAAMMREVLEVESAGIRDSESHDQRDDV